MRNALKELRRQENCYLLFQNMSNVGLQDLIFMMNSLEDQKKESLVASFQNQKINIAF